MGIAVVLAIAGVVLVGLGLLGGGVTGQFGFPRLARAERVFSLIGGLLFLLAAYFVDRPLNPQQPEPPVVKSTSTVPSEATAVAGATQPPIIVVATPALPSGVQPTIPSQPASQQQPAPQPTVQQLPTARPQVISTTQPQVDCNQGAAMPPLPAAPPPGCVLTVEWWYPPDPNPCGLWITYGPVEFKEGVAGHWWYEYDVSVPGHIKAFKAKPTSASCEVTDYRQR